MDDFEAKINIICKQLYKTNNNPRIEFDDLKQEAYLRYLQLAKLNKNDNFIFTSIRNHLINYIKKESRLREHNTGLNFEYINPLK
jgi:DNA-directed RNA polymerase specialized sigma24 family protein